MKENAKEIIQMRVDDLIPYDNNPRRNDAAVDKVANSIRAFGFKNPIIIDEHNVIICGHKRHKAAKKLGLKEVPCVVASGLTDEEIRAYCIADNKVAELAEWDEELLERELEQIDMNMTDFGLEPVEKIWPRLTDITEAVQSPPKRVFVVAAFPVENIHIAQKAVEQIQKLDPDFVDKTFEF